MSSEAATKIRFGPFEVTSQVFLTTPHSFALVNLKPLLPGHVLVCPSRPHRRLTDLSPPEVTDLFSTVQKVERMLARHYFPQPPTAATTSSTSSASSASSAPADKEDNNNNNNNNSSNDNRTGIEAGSFNIAVQDGPEAGQTVSHVHVHIIPRIRGLSSKPEDAPGDELYERMAAEEGNVGGALWDRDYRGSSSSRPVAGGKFDRIEDSQRGARSMEVMQAEAEMFKRVLREMEEEEEEEEGEGKGRG